MFVHIFLKIRIVKFASSQKLLELRAGIARKGEETESIIHKSLVMTADHKGSQCGERISFAASLRSRDAGPSLLLDSTLPNEKQNCARNDEEFAKFFPPDQKPDMIDTDSSLEFTRAFDRKGSSQVVKTYVGITTSQLHTDQKPTELPKRQFAGSKKVPLLFWYSKVFQKVVRICLCYLRNIQDKLDRMKEDLELHLMIQ